jgi:hypothetical protein
MGIYAGTALASHWMFSAIEAIYAQNDDNIEQLSCHDIALVLAVLDFSIELGDTESISATLEEADIAPDLESVYDDLDSVLDIVKAKCPNEQDILRYANLSMGGNIL